ncbi:Mmp37-domain-containing protein [Acaromyces ingoldii]|uniref:Phosphatidate cytidylyltransferase, mitochondrial n=1 Tax=Acaromyces ingoldii TaxID=215250 RepID=A0A316YVN6_9BASI|nr:Mmp37-domain-containing protein [Acaromyces ingoldii]PWN92113.1 Mmp37-domain-containing protein [Acaromyces ingoldii]
MLRSRAQGQVQRIAARSLSPPCSSSAWREGARAVPRPSHAPRIGCFSTTTRVSQGESSATSSSSSTRPGRYIETPSFPPPSFPRAFGANQVVPLDDELRGRLEKVMSHFNVPCRFAFAYGSGVFPQSEAGPEHAKKPSTKDGKKMIDLVLAVMHPEHWHAINMGDHPKHYSLISRMLGGIGVGLLQKRGAGLWYNPYVKMDDELVKYGVMDVDTLCQDLLDWDTLYISGRMHKPVAMLTTDARVRLAQQVNLTSALRTSLLLLPERFSEVELYTQVASLSYTGDFRMSVPGGENSSKVRNIVLAQREMFRRLYAGLVRSLGTVHVEEMREDRFAMTQDRSVKTRASYASRLPLRLREKLQLHYTSFPDRHPAFAKLSLSTRSDNVARKPGAKAAHLDPTAAEEFWEATVKQDDFEQVLLDKIGEIVRGPAWSQSLKGIYTAGLGRSLRYMMAKVGKYFEGKKADQK